MGEALPLAELLTVDRMLVWIEEDSYEAAVDLLLDRLEGAGIVTDRRAISDLVRSEAASDDLATIGERALLAHFRTDAISRLAVGIATSREPFPFAPETAPDARILLLIVAPKSAARYYLKVVSSLTRLFRDPEVSLAIADAASPEELLAVPRLDQLMIRPELMVHDLMSRSVNSVSPETPLTDVLRIMVRRGRRALPVVSDTGEVLGMVTEQEVLQHFLPQLLGAGALEGDDGTSLQDVEVRDVMQRAVMCLSDDQLISDVMGIMQNKNIPRFPVVREGKLIGFLSRSDLIRKLVGPSVQAAGL